MCVFAVFARDFHHGHGTHKISDANLKLHDDTPMRTGRENERVRSGERNNKTKSNTHRPRPVAIRQIIDGLLWIHEFIDRTVILHKSQISIGWGKKTTTAAIGRKHIHANRDTLCNDAATCRLNLIADYRWNINIEMNYRCNADERKKCEHFINCMHANRSSRYVYLMRFEMIKCN